MDRVAFSVSAADEVCVPSADGRSVQILPVSTSVSMRRLLLECHAIFTDTQARLGINAQDYTARSNTVRDASERYRAVTQTCWRVIEAEARKASTQGQSEDEVQALVSEAEALKIVHAVWQLAEVAYFVPEAAEVGASASAAAASPRRSPVLAFMHWLRENFMDVTTEQILSSILVRLRHPGAGVDAHLSRDCWDVVAKLAVEGQPHDAGKLLQVLARVRGGDKEIEEYANLLLAYPQLGAGATQAPAAYSRAWDAWHARALALRRAGLAVGHSSGVAEALMEVLCGQPWAAPTSTSSQVGLTRLACQGTLLSSPEAGSIVDADDPFPYARWYYLVLVNLLYCRSASSLTKAVLGQVVSDAISVCGEDSADPLLGTFARTLQGDAAASMQQLQAINHLWAATHLADLLWHAGALAVPAVWRGWDAPARAHFLLEMAVYLPTLHPSLVRPAVTYAAAATPEAVIVTQGVPEATVRSAVLAAGLPVSSGVEGGLGAQSAASTFATLDASRLDASMRRVKLAVLSGSSPSAHSVVQELLLRLPVESDADAVRACKLCTRLGHAAAAQRIASRWARYCMDHPAVVPASTAANAGSCLGNALLWYLRARDRQGEAAVAMRLRALMEAEIQATLQTAIATASAAISLQPGMHGLASLPLKLSDSLVLLRQLHARLHVVDAALRCIGHTGPSAPAVFPAVPQEGQDGRASTAVPDERAVRADGSIRFSALTTSDALRSALSHSPRLRQMLALRTLLSRLLTACEVAVEQHPPGQTQQGVPPQATDVLAASGIVCISQAAKPYFEGVASILCRLCEHRSASSSSSASTSTLSGYDSVSLLLRLSMMVGLFHMGVEPAFGFTALLRTGTSASASADDGQQQHSDDVSADPLLVEPVFRSEDLEKIVARIVRGSNTPIAAFQQPRVLGHTLKGVAPSAAEGEEAIHGLAVQPALVLAQEETAVIRPAVAACLTRAMLLQKAGPADAGTRSQRVGSVDSLLDSLEDMM
jgi:hypothetical protein